MNLADSRMDCLRGCLATLSVLVVRIALLEYSKIHEKAYKCIVCEFGGFQNVLTTKTVCHMNMSVIMDYAHMKTMCVMVTMIVKTTVMNNKTVVVCRCHNASMNQAIILN